MNQQECFLLIQYLSRKRIERGAGNGEFGVELDQSKERREEKLCYDFSVYVTSESQQC